MTHRQKRQALSYYNQFDPFLPVDHRWRSAHERDALLGGEETPESGTFSDGSSQGRRIAATGPGAVVGLLGPVVSHSTSPRARLIQRNSETVRQTIATRGKFRR
jgi:hypothetical protein